MKLKKLLAIVLVSVLFIPFLDVGKVFAATNVSISPSSGTVGENFDIAINVNTGTDEINGIDLDVTYEGNVTYSSSVAGDLGCTPIVNTETSGVIGLTCFITPGETFEGSGTLATLSFVATASGTIVFDIENVDIAGSSEGTVSGATLTVDMDYTGGSGTDADTDDELPTTGFFSDNIFLIVGGVFLVIGIVMAAVPETWNWMTLKKKQDAKTKEKFEKKVVSKTE